MDLVETASQPHTGAVALHRNLLADSRLCCSVLSSHRFSGLETNNEKTSQEDSFPPLCKIRTIKQYTMARPCSINYPATEARWQACLESVLTLVSRLQSVCDSQLVKEKSFRLHERSINIMCHLVS